MLRSVVSRRAALLALSSAACLWSGALQARPGTLPIQLAAAEQKTADRTVSSAPAQQRVFPPFLRSGQTSGIPGYVHFFVITNPEGERETQIGIEVEKRKIAWSLLDLGVTTSQFVSTGAIEIRGRAYQIEHLYGLRPFADRHAMAAFERALPARVAEWLDAAVPYCVEDQPTDHGCVSCLGFIARLLFPGPVFGALPVLPPDFRSARKGVYTTEDLLMYLSGIPLAASRERRLDKIQRMDLPENLREELARLSNEVEPLADAPVPLKRRAAALPKRMAPGRKS